ncbi:MAG: hypothetical protein KME16_04330 [Scytolyngbya sp. HA4215-MV1]|nr:hypothetical protein [Scytolyngbya sp. HA4215-MV1]
MTSVLSQAPIYSPTASQDAELLKQLSFVPGLKEILLLRQVHALEHATVWVLSRPADGAPRSSQRGRPADNGQLGGMSTDKGFYLYGQVNLPDLHRGVRVALQRLTSGEWDLAVHPRCGTNFSVALALTAGFALSTSLLLPRGPIEQLLGLGLATTAAAYLAPDLGAVVQRYITTAVPFNLEVDRILPLEDPLGRSAHFIRVHWIES